MIDVDRARDERRRRMGAGPAEAARDDDPRRLVAVRVDVIKRGFACHEG
jgi:hypothetical protein